jgi:hypothetical protein
MLAIAISTFFLIAFLASATVIAMMFFQYRGKISAALHNGLAPEQKHSAVLSAQQRKHSGKAPQLMLQHRSRQPVPLRAAA